MGVLISASPNVPYVRQIAVPSDGRHSDSNRRVEPPGHLSLGPLAPGAYLIELHGAGGRRTERIRIVDRDVNATLR